MLAMGITSQAMKRAGFDPGEYLPCEAIELLRRRRCSDTVAEILAELDSAGYTVAHDFIERKFARIQNVGLDVAELQKENVTREN